MSIKHIVDVLTMEEIEYIKNLEEVKNAKNEIEKKGLGYVNFTITLNDEIKNHIWEKFGLDIRTIEKVPMRWIKGDTKPHVDVGETEFQNTYLIYLTDSEGDLLINGETYSMTEGNGYMFSEGYNHETINTGYEPRLVLGPMSEEGFRVGGPLFSISGAGGTTIYIRQNGSDIEYSPDNTSWNSISWPCNVINTDSSGGVLEIQFTTDILINNASYQCFVCTTDYIQFGITDLNEDGTKPSIIIDGITDYEGFISNGNSVENGYNHIYVYNLGIKIKNGSTIRTSTGWIGQEYFGKGATNNYIINCSSDGPISDYSGGIAGGKVGSINGNVSIIGCSSTGVIGESGGGIVGYEAGDTNGTVSCQSCRSSGVLSSVDAGGIIGSLAGQNSGTITITNCYASGGISGNRSGGIIGRYASGSINISNCYFEGTINSVDAGGIIGSNATDVNVSNCYTIGTINNEFNAGGICGNNATNVNISNCYTSGGRLNGAFDNGYILGGSTVENGTAGSNTLVNNYSEAKNSSSGWNSTNANSVLTGIPSPTIGTIWISTGINQPYELKNMGYTGYTVLNILSTPGLKRTYSTSVISGEETGKGLVSSIFSKKNITTGGFTVGGTVTKDMSIESYDDQIDPYDYQSSFFPGMANFVDGNIIAGDKDSGDRLNATYWSDLGNDVFDDWGYFYIYDVSMGKYYFPLIISQNQPDGVFKTQTFDISGHIFTITHGWAVQGIFKFEISVNDNMPFRFGGYGNMGSDGDEFYEDLTYAYSIGSTNLTLYYHHHAEDGNSDEQLWSYFIPKKVSENNSQTYNVYYDGDDMSMVSKVVSEGLIVYFAKRNDVKEWVVNDLNIASYSILSKSGGTPSSYGTITIDSQSGLISTTTSTAAGIYTLLIRNTGSYHYSELELTVSSSWVPCLTEETMVLTEEGYKNIKELKRGDKVKTSDNREVRIVNIFKSVVKTSKDTYPCRIPKNSIGLNYPKEDFMISQNHLIRYNKSWILPKKYFEVDSSIKTIDYYHIELPDYKTDHLVINDGVIVESLGTSKLEYQLEYYNRLKSNGYNPILHLTSGKSGKKIKKH